ncbi:GNAT family N-acetyltransferase [Dokdonella sp.]|uniref:GNAT family N-acetyltransferase n=1 Tax=Dokdonella sp. TaxID=2291710 RepID=UPI003C415974
MTDTPTARPDESTLRIRRAVSVDLPELIALENRVFSGDRLSARQWSQHLASDTARIFVARSQSTLLGASVVFFRRNSSVARLYSLATLPEARGRGIGDRLVAAVEQLSRRRQCRALRLEVRSDNAAAQRLYLQRGYRLIGERLAYYEDGVDALRFEKLLSGKPSQDLPVQSGAR